MGRRLAELQETVPARMGRDLLAGLPPALPERLARHLLAEMPSPLSERLDRRILAELQTAEMPAGDDPAVLRKAPETPHAVDDGDKAARRVAEARQGPKRGQRGYAGRLI